MRRREAPTPLVVARSGPLSAEEEQRVRELLRTPPSDAALAEIDAIAGLPPCKWSNPPRSQLISHHSLSRPVYDGESVIAGALYEMLRTRYVNPFDYWRAL